MSGFVTAFLSAVCYSLAYVFLHKGQHQLERDDNGLFPVLFVSFFALGIAAVTRVIFGPGLQLQNSAQWMGYGYCVGSGIVGTLLGRRFLYSSIRQIGATRGIVLKTLETLVTLFLAIQFLKEQLQLKDFIGMMLLFGGILLLMFEQMRNRSNRHTFSQGILYAIGAIVLLGTGHFFRKLGTTLPINAVVGAALDVSAAFIGYVLVLERLGKLRERLENVRSYNVYIWIAGFLSSSGVLLFFVAVSSAPLSMVVIITGIQPILVALFSGVLSRDLERLNGMTALCAIAAAVGVILMK